MVNKEMDKVFVPHGEDFQFNCAWLSATLNAS